MSKDIFWLSTRDGGLLLVFSGYAVAREGTKYPTIHKITRQSKESPDLKYQQY